MHKRKNFLKQPGGYVLLFGLAALLLGWPFLTIFSQGFSPAIFTYLFVVWGMLILGLFLINRGLQDIDEEEDFPETE